MARYVGIAAGIWTFLFAGSALLGYYLSQRVAPPGEPSQLVGGLDIFLEVLKTNLIVAIMLLAGTITLGVTTILQLVANAIPPGILIGFAVRQFGAKWVLHAVAVHSIIEIPALMLFSGAGLYGASLVWRALRDGEPGVRREAALKSLIQTSTAGILLLACAAGIEAWITPLMLEV